MVNPIGSTLQQRYQILEQLGKNGAVTTYLAIDLQIPGNIQLKCAIHRYEIADPTPDSNDWYRALLSAQALYTLTRQVDRLPIVYGYFSEGNAFYLVREFVVGIPLAQELLADRPWSQSQVAMLLVDLLEVLHNIDREAMTPDRVSLNQIIRRNLDRKLVLINLPLRHQAPQIDRSLVQHNLQTVGAIAIAAATGRSGSDLAQIPIQQWQDLAPQLVGGKERQSKLVTMLDRLIATEPDLQYPSIAAAWQAVAGVMSQLLIERHYPSDPQVEIGKHIQLLVDRGTKFYEMGDCPQAIIAYDQAIKLDPRCVEAYCGRGNARRYQGDYSGSWEDFNTAVELDPDRGVAYIGRGLAKCFGSTADPNVAGDFQQGQILLTAAKNPIEYVMRGTAKAQLGDPQGAIDDYTIAIELNPRLVLAYNNRGNLRQHFGDLDGAVADFSTVLEINPHSSIAYNNRAIIYTQIGEFPAAIDDYSKAIELQPDFVSVYNNQGNAYCQMGDYVNAIDRYSQAIVIDPKFAVAYSNRANIYRVRGHLAEAIVDYDQAISLDPELVIAYYNRGICQRQIGNHQAAIGDYTKALSLDPQYFYAYYHRGNTRQYLGDKHGAIADYTQTIYFDPDHFYAYYNRAVTRIDLDDVRGALEDLERSIKLNPEFTLAYYQRGRLLAKYNKHLYAIPNYQRAIELDPTYLNAYYYRGCSYQILGDLPNALTDFSQSINLDPDYAPAYFQRAKISAQLGDRTGAITDYHKAANLYFDRGDSHTYQQILQLIDLIINGN